MKGGREMTRFTLFLIAALVAVMPTLAAAGDCSTVENNNIAIHAVPELVHQKVTFDVTASHTPLDEKYSDIDNISVFTGGAGFKVSGVKLGMGVSHYTNGKSYAVKGGDSCVGNTALAMAGFVDLGESARLKLGVARSSDIIDSLSIENTTFHAGLSFGF